MLTMLMQNLQLTTLQHLQCYTITLSLELIILSFNYKRQTVSYDIFIQSCFYVFIVNYLCLQIAWEDAQRLAKRRIEREQGRDDAANDLSELSEGEKEKGDANISDSSKYITRINSDLQMWNDEDKSNKNLYIVLIRYVNT